MYMKRKIENIIYSYDPKQFMPIYIDGTFSNRKQYIAYKISKLRHLQIG